MTSPLLLSLSATEAALAQLRLLIESEPAFADWRVGTSGVIDPGHIQLFPVNGGYYDPGRGTPERLASARRIARAVGGEWEADDSGCWWQFGGSGKQSWSLHHVEAEVKPKSEKRVVDLSEPPSIAEIEALLRAPLDRDPTFVPPLPFTRPFKDPDPAEDR